MNSLESFLLGSLTTTFAIAAVYFLRFWRETRDGLFLAFGASFAMEAFSRAILLFEAHPNEARPWIYLLRLAASLLLLGAIVRKNYGAKQ